MPTVVGIRFKKACKIYYFDPTEIVLAEGDGVIVETGFRYRGNSARCGIRRGCYRTA